jgi:Fe-S-cluster-containing dehydrogenase component
LGEGREIKENQKAKGKEQKAKMNAASHSLITIYSDARHCQAAVCLGVCHTSLHLETGGVVDGQTGAEAATDVNL